ncbi:TetR/AcrR family transcriptional regulator [Candidatus Cetobacterium colombiensis]|jgi:AcrR family transcriptional regulator|uniref:Helix-turn-helix domain-containing protein n=1 Tax=Candidatus Cetobacterium colombiensis TaxID=3073100 RepID=A0ABU4WA34_9FUSO|nr:helix-turn-helix domain-containing protein [Candidatus Cetobacterium colombiensis]MDX8335275.1 helix-turn-helix domain-containing protein [Candidatus Cetobacterium colombiensis]
MTKRDRIKRTATILFAANGIRNTKIEDIANVLEMAKGGFYYYFKSKEELLHEIMDNSVISRKEFLKEVGDLNISFEDKLKMIVTRRLSLRDDRYNLFLFAKIFENGEISLTQDDYMKRDIIFSEFLKKNKEHIKDEYRDEIEKIRAILSTSLTVLLLYLIAQTGVTVTDEESYKEMIQKYSTLDINREVEMFYNLYLKSMIK